MTQVVIGDVQTQKLSAHPHGLGHTFHGSRDVEHMLQRADVDDRVKLALQSLWQRLVQVVDHFDPFIGREIHHLIGHPTKGLDQPVDILVLDIVKRQIGAVFFQNRAISYPIRITAHQETLTSQDNRGPKVAKFSVGF